VANFLAVKQFPFLVMKLHIEVLYELWMYKIQKCIPNITIILNYHILYYLIINWKVKKVNFFFMILVKQLKQQLFIVLVRNVSYHDSRSAILKDIRNVNCECIHLRVSQIWVISMANILLLAFLKLWNVSRR
jgi:hypothetical protein